MPRARPRVQVCVKRFHGRCLLCGEDDYAVLHAHRPCEGGPYQWGNVMTLCANCHMRVHAGRVEVLGRFWSTAGYYVWRVIDEGCERFLPDVKKEQVCQR